MKTVPQQFLTLDIQDPSLELFLLDDPLEFALRAIVFLITLSCLGALKSSETDSFIKNQWF